MKTHYVEVSPAQKLKLLNEHSAGCKWSSLDDSQWCLHCEKQFAGHSVRVYRDPDGSLWLECGTPGCDGSPIDWAPYPWWDKNHPETKARNKARDKAFKKLDRVTRSKKPTNN